MSVGRSDSAPAVPLVAAAPVAEVAVPVVGVEVFGVPPVAGAPGPLVGASVGAAGAGRGPAGAAPTGAGLPEGAGAADGWARDMLVSEKTMAQEMDGSAMRRSMGRSFARAGNREVPWEAAGEGWSHEGSRAATSCCGFLFVGALRVLGRLVVPVVVLLVLWPARAAAQPMAGAAGTSGPGLGGPPSSNAARLARPELVETDLIDSPRPIVPRPRGSSLPELTHRSTGRCVVHTLGTLRRRDGGRAAPQIASLDFEIPLIKGFLYAGAEWAGALARETDGRMRVALGQPWLKGRVVHTLGGRYVSLGAGLAFSPPIFTYDDYAPEERLLRTTTAVMAASLLPWEFSSFQDRRFTVRPTLDLRAKSRRLLAQFQQGLDVSIATGRPEACETCPRAGNTQLVSTSALYLGVQPRDAVSVGVETFLVYLLRTQWPIDDRDRSALTVAPNVRYVFRWVEPSVSLLIPVGPPLLRAFENPFALRIDVRIWLGRR